MVSYISDFKVVSHIFIHKLYTYTSGMWTVKCGTHLREAGFYGQANRM